MRNNWKIAFLTLTLIMGGAALTAGPVLAQQTPAPTPAQTPPPGGGMMQGCPGGGWLQALNLTPEQISKGRQIMEDAEKQLNQPKAELKTQKIDLKNTLMQENIDQNQINKIASQIGNIESRIVTTEAKMVSDLLGLLNPEQRQRAAMMMWMMDKDGMGKRGGKDKGDWDD